MKIRKSRQQYPLDESDFYVGHNMEDIAPREDYIASIDLGSSNVTVVLGEKTADGRLKVTDATIKPMQGVSFGMVNNIEQIAESVAEALDELEERTHVRITHAYVGVSGSHIRCTTASCSIFVSNKVEITQEDVQKLSDNTDNIQPPAGIMLLDKIAQNYTVDAHEPTNKPVGAFGQKLSASYVFILGSHVAIDRLYRAFERMNIRIDSMYINPLASAEAVLMPDEKDLGVAMVNIGGDTTEVAIVGDNIVHHVGVIPIGSNAVNRDIRSVIAIPDGKADSLKITRGRALASNLTDDMRQVKINMAGHTQRDVKSIMLPTLVSIIEARMRDIVELVLKEIKDAGYDDRLPAGLVLTGGGALLNDIESLFQQLCKYDVRIAAPEVGLTQESLAFVDDPKFSTAVGLLLLACGGANYSNNDEINDGFVQRDNVPPARETVFVPDPVDPTTPEPTPEPQPSIPEPKPHRRGLFRSRRKSTDNDSHGRDNDSESGSGSNIWSRITDAFSTTFDPPIDDDGDGDKL